MRWFEETLAGDSPSRPTAVEPRETLLIEVDGTGASSDSTNKPPVHHGDHDERCDGNEKQQVDRIEVAQPEQDPGQTEPGQSKL